MGIWMWHLMVVRNCLVKGYRRDTRVYIEVKHQLVSWFIVHYLWSHLWSLVSLILKLQRRSLRLNHLIVELTIVYLHEMVGGGEVLGSLLISHLLLLLLLLLDLLNWAHRTRRRRYIGLFFDIYPLSFLTMSRCRAFLHFLVYLFNSSLHLFFHKLHYLLWSIFLLLRANSILAIGEFPIIFMIDYLNNRFNWLSFHFCDLLVELGYLRLCIQQFPFQKSSLVICDLSIDFILDLIQTWN